MLRITVHEDSSSWRMQLEGKLIGPWAAEASNAWQAALTAGKRVEVDLSDVTAVDDAGEQLLRQMHQSGACLTAEGVEMKALIADIVENPSCANHLWKKVRQLVSFSALLLVIPALSLRAQDAAPLRLTLKDAVALALKQNPQVAIANLNLAESQEQRDAARSHLLPQIGISASDKITRGNVETLLGKKIPGFPGHVGPFWAVQAGAGFSVPIFDLTLWRNWQAARETVGANAAAETTARESISELVVSQYLGSLRATADVNAARSRMDLAKSLLDLATDLQNNGAGTRIDTLRANVQYQNEKQRFTEASTQLKIDLYGLNRLLNLDASRGIELSDAPSFFETPAFQSDESIERALEQRPEMKTILAQKRSAELDKSAAKSQRLPRLSLSGGWSEQGVTPNTMIPAYEYGASLDIPLFTGGRIQAETAIAALRIKKLAQTETDLRNQIALQVKTAVAQLESARTEVDAANLGVSLASESVTQAQDRFRAGVANNIEVVTAQDELARANDNQITALYRYNQSRADLARATGQMELLYAK